ncbi:MAG: HAMP domain-containing protein, partial [Desulfobulbaceae bacterium]|nr:HAMP domain-containing protein [Desulfobulbaceae bacterium]
HKTIEKINSLCDELAGAMDQEINRAHVSNTKKAVNIYFAAFEKYVSLRVKQVNQEDLLVNAAKNAEKNFKVLLADLKCQLAEVRKKRVEQQLDKLAKADDGNRLIHFALECRREEKNYIISGDEKYVKKCLENAEKIFLLSNDLVERYKDEKNKRLVGIALKDTEKYVYEFNAFVSATNAQKIVERKMIEDANKAVEAAGLTRKIQKNKMIETMKHANFIFIVVTFAAVSLGLLFAIVIARTMARPVGRAVEVADAVARGDVTQRLNMKSRDDIGMLAQAIDRVPETIQNVVRVFENIIKDIEVGKLYVRGDSDQFDGVYADVVKGGNDLIDILVGHVNAIPAPAMLIDKEFNIMFMN